MTTIPPVPVTGWTPQYLAQLNAVANSIIVRPDTTRLHDLSEDELDLMMDATEKEWREYQDAGEARVADTLSPKTWVDHRVAERRHLHASLAAIDEIKGEG